MPFADWSTEKLKNNLKHALRYQTQRGYREQTSDAIDAMRTELAERDERCAAVIVKTKYVVTVNRPMSNEQAVRVMNAILAVDDSEPIPVPGSGGVGPNGIRYDDIALGARVTIRYQG